LVVDETIVVTLNDGRDEDVSLRPTFVEVEILTLVDDDELIVGVVFS